MEDDDPREELDAVGSRIGDTSDLPPELKSQLASSQMDDMEEKILHTLKERYDGVANLDEIIVGLYRDFGYVTKDRRSLNGKLYRMRKRGLLENVPKRKGVYRVKT